MAPRVKPKPAGHFVTVNGRCVVDAGKDGMIRDRDVAGVIRDFLQLANPEADVAAYEVFTLTGPR